MRIKELDSIRGIAALAVLLYHYTTGYTQNYDLNWGYSFPYGWLGVPLFFILSGFVITLTINRCKSPLEFLIKRFIRLYPTYWICLSTTLLFIYLFDAHYLKMPLIAVIANYSMFTEFLGFKYIDGAYWSLLPELLFYGLMTFLMFLDKKNDIFYVNIICIFLCVFNNIYPIAILSKILNLNYILLFMIGIFLYDIYIGKVTNKYTHMLIALNVTIAAYVYPCWNMDLSVFKLITIFGIFVAIFYLIIYGKMSFLARSKSLLFLGKISYPLYLIHENVGFILIRYWQDKFESNHVGLIILALIVSISLAAWICFCLEPILKDKMCRLRQVLINER